MKNRLFPKSVLITQGELVNYAGSELITLELAEFLSKQGSKVHVLTNYISMPIESDFKKLPNVFIHADSSNIDFISLDLIWIHHQLIPLEIIKLAENGELNAKVVFHHMSSFLPLEFPFFINIETYLADLILYNSYLTKNTIEGKLKNSNFKGVVLNNPTPDRFIPIEERKYNKKLKNLLVVSNHPPPEILEAIKILKQSGVRVKKFGVSSQQEYRRIEPKDILWADAIVSTGKTVQYAIQSTTPVFCYDHFGGPGYLNEDNFTVAAKLGFSGKGFTTKSYREIVNELQAGLVSAQRYSKLIYKNSSTEYLLSSKMSIILKSLETTSSRKKIKISQSDIVAFEALNELLWSLHGGYLRLLNTHNESMAVANKYLDSIKALDANIKSLNNQLNGIINSLSWKITAPLRKANKAAKRWK